LNVKERKTNIIYKNIIRYFKKVLKNLNKKNIPFVKKPTPLKKINETI